MSEPAPISNPTPEEVEEAERQEQIKRNQPLIELLQSWRDEFEVPTEEDVRLFQECIRDFDSFRPHRPLFADYYRDLGSSFDDYSKSGKEPSGMVAAKRQRDESDEEQRQHQILLNQEAIAFLDLLLADETESAEEQQSALVELMRGIDANRDDGRKLFTEYLAR